MGCMSHFLKEARKGVGGWSQRSVLRLGSQAMEQLVLHDVFKLESMTDGE